MVKGVVDSVHSLSIASRDLWRCVDGRHQVIITRRPLLGAGWLEEQ
jgi:hypothetical protein